MSKPYIALATAQPVRESTLDPPINDRPKSHKRLRVATPPADEEPWPAVISQPVGRVGDTSMVQAATQTETEVPEVRRTADTSNGPTNGPAPAATPNKGTFAREITPGLLTEIRNSISEQFDIEIVLKHRELRVIESELAKTQACIEQLRRCTLIPYPGPETQLDQKPSYSGFPDYHPPPPGAVDGPYTRHYRQWLLHDKKFGDAPATESSYAGSRRYSGNDQFTNTGRPQRQSAMKAQPTRVEGQGCLYRKRDGQLVRLVCITCKRSNFSSAQGFINHCRIAHGNEYASHDLAADACGEPVDESTLNLTPPALAPPVDGPARNTRNTYNPLPPSPQESSHTHTRRSSAISAVSPSLPLHTPRPTRPQQRKASRKPAMTTPKTQQDTEGVRPPTPPTERGSFSTTHLEALMKSKNFNIDVDEVMKSVTGGFEDMSGFSESELGTEDERASSVNPEGRHPLQTPESMGSTPANGVGNRMPTQDSSRTSSSGFTGFLPTPHNRRAGLIGHRTVPSPLDLKKEEKEDDGDVLMGDGYDAGFSSSDEGGYDSDAGGDDDLYEPPPPRNDVQEGSATTTVPYFPGTINPSMLHLTGTSSPAQPASP